MALFETMRTRVAKHGDPPGDYDGTGHRGNGGHGDVHRELLAGTHVLLHVLIAPEVRPPHLVRQKGQEEVSHEPADAPRAQGAEEVSDQVSYSRPPGPRRAEQQPEDNWKHVRRPD